MTIRSDRPTTVVNIKDEDHDIYIGRAVPRAGLPKSMFANPFKIKKADRHTPAVDRAAVIVLYEGWLRREIREGRITREALFDLKGAVLGCWCKPEPCHGDILALYAEAWGVVTLSDDKLFQEIQDIGRIDDWNSSWWQEKRSKLYREYNLRLTGALGDHAKT